MKESIQNLESELVDFHAPVLKYFHPPLSDENTLKEFVRLHWGNDVEIPAELIEIYRWHNGTNYKATTDGIIRLGYIADELCFISLEKVDEVVKEDTFNDFLSNKMFPLFLSLNGETLAVRLDKTGQLFYFSTQDFELDRQVSMYDSLETLFKTIVQFYKESFFIADEDGVIELDLDRYDEYIRLGEKMNPNSDYWRVKRQLEDYN